MSLLDRLPRFAYDPDDTEDVRLEKRAIFVVAGSCSLAGLVWTGMYAMVFGPGLITAWPAIFTLVVSSALLASHVSRNHHHAVHAQIICIIQITFFIQWHIGSLTDSGFVIVWALCGPITALVFYAPRGATLTFVLYLANVVVTVLLGDVLSRGPEEVSGAARTLFLVMNVCVSSTIVFVFAVSFVNSALEQRRRADRLLLNILPREVAPRLKEGAGETIADGYDSASVLFADIVGSTPLFAEMSAREAVDWLNEVFSMFDRLTEKHGVEKIRTIGDNYMVAAGVPTRRADHAEALVRFALDMAEGLGGIAPRKGRRMAFRIGVHTGPLVAGVIGEIKFQYDLWGDTVNVASRMESHGEAGRVHISESTHEKVRDAFRCTSRDVIEVKGRGPMRTWFVDGPR